MTPVRPVYLRTKPTEVPSAYRGGIVLDVFDDKAESTLANNLEDLVRAVGQPTDAARDFLLFSAAVYVADKRTSRARADDRWSRRFKLRTAVAETGAWIASEPMFTSALEFLTGDRWELSFRRSRNALPRVWKIGSDKYAAVCLFSGGLDSLAGAIQLLATTRGRVLLVGHHDSSLTAPAQRGLYLRLADHFGTTRVDLLQMLVRPGSASAEQEYPLPDEHEETTRSRSLIFLALALAAASAIGPKVKVWMPENGYISLNAPLTGARIGSCSTRTTHPFFMDALRHALDAVGLAHSLHNPFASLTKGEILARSPLPELVARLAPRSVSCAHPEAGRWNPDAARRGVGNCGYCYPCIVRRAALHAIGVDWGGEYAYDVLRDVSLVRRGPSVRGRDWRAVLAMLQDNTGLGASPLAILRAGRLPSGQDLAALVDMHARGTAELRSFAAAATSRVRSAAGLA